MIGGREFPREASQSLGQKNTSFTIYLALTYANPLVALGPTCYVLWHNLWNSWQLHQSRHHGAGWTNFFERHTLKLCLRRRVWRRWGFHAETE